MVVVPLATTAWIPGFKCGNLPIQPTGCGWSPKCRDESWRRGESEEWRGEKRRGDGMIYFL